jgi:hypothetical protein
MWSMIRVWRPVIGWIGTMRELIAAGARRIGFVAALMLITVAAIIAGSGLAKSNEPNANQSCSGPTKANGSCVQIATVPKCPGRMTADGLACCAPGSTPSGNDNCQLPGGGLAASCPLGQLTALDLCCPTSSTPKSDGTCQPANGSKSVSACPLSQLDKGGLSCCPLGTAPQPDGSCAATTCPGPVTADGLACCAAGSTPTGDDTCQLSGGGVATSCPLSQLTVLGSCCPATSTPLYDGSCQPQNGSSSASACPLGQIDKGGLTCCPFGQVPQANGSCQLNTPTPTCPTGFTLNGKGQCLAALVCPSGNQPINGAGVCCPPPSQYVTNTPPTTNGQGVSEFGQSMCGYYDSFAICNMQENAYGYEEYDLCSGPVTTGVPTTPTCPSGATLGSTGSGNNITYSCVQTGVEPSCPTPYVIFLDTCVLPNCPNGGFRNPDGNCVPAQSQSMSSTPISPSPRPPAPLPPAPLPIVGCPAGYTPINGKCVRGSDTCPPGQVHGTNGACVCTANETTNPDGTCTCLPSLMSGPNGTCAPKCQTASSATSPGEVFGPNGICVRCPTGSAPDWITDASCLPWCPSGSVINNAGGCVAASTTLCPSGGVRDVNGACCQPSQLTNSLVCCPSGQEPQSDGTCSCPVGEIVGLDGYCAVRSSKQCPPGEAEAPDGNCVRAQELRPPPPRQSNMTTGVPLQSGCANGYVLGADNSCHRVTGPACPSGQTMVDGKCACPAGHIAKANGACVCPPRGGPCEAGQVQGPDCNCVAAPTTATCASGEELVNGQCQCLPGEVADPQKGGCIRGLVTTPTLPISPGTPAPITPGAAAPTPSGTPLNPTCTVRGQLIENGHCQCPSGTVPRDGSCMATSPPAGSKTLTPQKILTLPPKRIVTPPPPPRIAPRIARPTTPTLKLPSGLQYKQER